MLSGFWGVRDLPNKRRKRQANLDSQIQCLMRHCRAFAQANVLLAKITLYIIANAQFLLWFLQWPLCLLLSFCHLLCKNINRILYLHIFSKTLHEFYAVFLFSLYISGILDTCDTGLICKPMYLSLIWIKKSTLNNLSHSSGAGDILTCKTCWSCSYMVLISRIYPSYVLSITSSLM